MLYVEVNWDNRALPREGNLGQLRAVPEGKLGQVRAVPEGKLGQLHELPPPGKRGVEAAKAEAEAH